MSENPKNINLPRYAVGAAITAKAVKAIIKDAPEMMYRCVACGCDIPPGKSGRRCRKCREVKT